MLNEYSVGSLKVTLIITFHSRVMEMLIVRAEEEWSKCVVC